jgi:hypothetical protein
MFASESIDIVNCACKVAYLVEVTGGDGRLDVGSDGLRDCAAQLTQSVRNHPLRSCASLTATAANRFRKLDPTNRSALTIDIFDTSGANPAQIGYCRQASGLEPRTLP